jgi:hypothetical protein
MLVEECIPGGVAPGVDEEGHCGPRHRAVKVEIGFDPDADDRPWP